MATKKQKPFDSVFTITPAMDPGLMRIEAVRQAIKLLPSRRGCWLACGRRPSCFPPSTRT